MLDWIPGIGRVVLFPGLDLCLIFFVLSYSRDPWILLELKQNQRNSFSDRWRGLIPLAMWLEDPWNRALVGFFDAFWLGVVAGLMAFAGSLGTCFAKGEVVV